MSAIAGWIDHRRDLGPEERTVRAMVATMAYRGPDGGGTWSGRHAGLGVAVLAGADGEPGTGPAVARVAEAMVVAVGDGVASTAVLDAYLRRGDALVDELGGAFAFAVWDGRRDQLLLSRDRMGVKPLYYAEHDGGLLFASVPSGIVAHPGFEARLDLASVPFLLQPRLALPGETPMVGLAEVPPAHLVVHRGCSPVRHRYWRIESAPHGDRFDRTAERVRELLEDAVAWRVPPAGPCAAMLSGGVDSSGVAALAAAGLAAEGAGRALDTYCVDLDGGPDAFVASELRPEIDTPYAALAADHIGSRHTTVTVTSADLAAAVPACRRARDLPAWGQLDASMHILCGRMRATGPVALSGEAADEIFGGYPYMFKPEVVARPGFPWLGVGPRLAHYLTAEVTAVVDPVEDERARCAELLAAVPRLPGEDPFEARMREVLYLGLAGPLAVVLDREERMGMAHGLEVRIPFCDHRLVEYLVNVPWALKTRGGPKGLLKAALADRLAPATVARAKSAYPHLQDPAYDAALIDEATWIVNGAGSTLGELINAPRFNELVEDIKAGRLRSALPGGSSGAFLLVNLIEAHHWIEDLHVSVR